MTRRAAAAIAAAMQELQRREGAKDLIPVVCWSYASPEPDDRGDPCIAVDSRDNIPADLLQHAYGLEFATNLPEEQLAALSDSLLDYLDGQLLFVDRDAVRFLGD